MWRVHQNTFCLSSQPERRSQGLFFSLSWGCESYLHLFLKKYVHILKALWPWLLFRLRFTMWVFLCSPVVAASLRGQTDVQQICKVKVRIGHCTEIKMDFRNNRKMEICVSWRGKKQNPNENSSNDALKWVQHATEKLLKGQAKWVIVGGLLEVQFFIHAEEVQ